MKTRKMTTENLRETLSKATPSNPFQFFKHVNCIYDGSRIVWRGCLPVENIGSDVSYNPQIFLDLIQGAEDRVLEGVDPFTLRKITWYLLADSRFVIQNGIILDGIDGASFQSLSRSRDEIYFKDKDSVYVEKFGKLKKLDNADPITFQNIGPVYAKDKNRFFYSDIELEGLSEKYQLNECGFLYDDTVIYHYGFRIDMDAKTFEVLDFEKNPKVMNPHYRSGPYRLKDKNGTYLYEDISKKLSLIQNPKL
ncbi:DKNYY domain-containing protein [Leptospira santarosai]|uniref:DKNYY domain-containing protein n=1 Tax=Leptospira santarosai TaxID=28183 RepID=UPI0007736915|nr:DKNYY domain-containing protein [Leptospira santarosai]MDI7202958.1 DKNYY domain-containing protein [Leptospira santarosai]